MGRPRTAWPGLTVFPCSTFDTGGVRSALLHRQSLECSAGPRSTTRTRLLAFWPSLIQPLVALWRLRCLKAFSSLTISSDSSAPPALRLPGLLHYREGFIPLTVAPTSGQPIRRMPPWSTCGHTQGLVRITPPSSTECNFMSQRTTHLGFTVNSPSPQSPPVRGFVNRQSPQVVGTH